jgi:spermidine synthase
MIGSSTDINPSTKASGMPGWLYCLFFLSGSSGLLYEVVWLRILIRILGNTVYAASTVLAAFMAGLALGSFLVRRFTDRSQRPLRVYGFLEVGIGLSALSSLLLPDRLLPVYRSMYEMAGGSRAWLTAGQVAIALAVLLLPTALMGATLPMLCAFAARRQEAFGRCVGTLYALNTLGAVIGVVLGGFFLLGAIGETNTIFVGVFLNGVVAIGAFRHAAGGSIGSPAAMISDLSGSSAVHPVDQSAWPPRFSARVRGVVLACFAASGFIAMANEVVWSRMLLLYQGTSVYAFSAMLAVLLTGMGVGSFLGARFADRWPDPLRLLAHLQLAIGLSCVAALHLFDRGAVVKADLGTGQHLALLMLAPVVLLGPMGLLWGVAFPVAAHCYGRGHAAGQGVADLYGWNTVGCIVGSLAAGFGLIPLLGASVSGSLLAASSFCLGAILLLVHPEGAWRETRLAKWCWVGACGLLLATVGDPYYRLLRRHMDQVFPGRVEVFRHTEDADGTTTAFGASSSDPRDKHLWVGGEGMTVLATMTKLMAHLPLWLADQPRDVLVICFGMGTTVRSASRHPDLQVWAVEQMPAVLDCFGYYYSDGPELLQRPNIHPVVEDGRNFLLMHSRRYDVISIDPAPPLYSTGTVNLYSREFFQLCRERVRPGGIVCLWVPPGNESEVKAIMRTFLDVFEYVSVWEGPSLQIEGKGFYLLGSRMPLRGIAQKVHKAFETAPAVTADLVEWGGECDRPEKVLALYIGDEQQLRPLVSDAPIITDDRPYTEFPLWRAVSGRGEYYRILNGPELRKRLRGEQHK